MRLVPYVLFVVGAILTGHVGWLLAGLAWYSVSAVVN